MQSTAFSKPQTPKPYVIGGASLEPGFENTDREDYYSRKDDFFNQTQQYDAEPFIKTEKRTFTGSLEFKRKDDDQILKQVQDDKVNRNDSIPSESMSLPDVGGKAAHGALEGMQFILSATPDIKLVTNTVKETTGAVGELITKNILNMDSIFGNSAKKESSNPADEAKKAEAKARIREIMAQYEHDKMRLEMKKQEEAQKTMDRLGVTHQDILATKGARSNVNYEGYLTLANVVLADMAKGWAKIKQMMSQGISSSAKGKKSDLSMHSGAQEGQSMVSSSGSIVSAG